MTDDLKDVYENGGDVYNSPDDLRQCQGCLDEVLPAYLVTVNGETLCVDCDREARHDS